MTLLSHEELSEAATMAGDGRSQYDWPSKVSEPVYLLALLLRPLVGGFNRRQDHNPFGLLSLQEMMQRSNPSTSPQVIQQAISMMSEAGWIVLDGDKATASGAPHEAMIRKVVDLEAAVYWFHYNSGKYALSLDGLSSLEVLKLVMEHAPPGRCLTVVRAIAQLAKLDPGQIRPVLFFANYMADGLQAHGGPNAGLLQEAIQQYARQPE